MKVNGCGTHVILALIIAGMAVFALALAIPAEADGIRVNVFFVPRGYTPCGPAFCGPPMCGGPVVFGSPPMYGGGCGYNPYFQPPPRQFSRPMQFGGYSRQPQGFYGNPYGGGLDLVYDEAYQRRVRQLEQDRQYQLERMARDAARRDAERRFYGRGW